MKKMILDSFESAEMSVQEMSRVDGGKKKGSKPVVEQTTCSNPDAAASTRDYDVVLSDIEDLISIDLMNPIFTNTANPIFVDMMNPISINPVVIP